MCKDWYQQNKVPSKRRYRCKEDLVIFVSVLLRLHEFDEQVAAVREGMARVVPVPLLSLFTGYELETMVSGCSVLPRAALIH